MIVWQAVTLIILRGMARPGKTIAKQSVGRAGAKNRWGWAGENNEQFEQLAR
jgi:hypothetical protein